MRRGKANGNSVAFKNCARVSARWRTSRVRTPADKIVSGSVWAEHSTPWNQPSRHCTMRAPQADPTEFIATFSRQRQQLLARVGQTFPEQAVATDADKAEALGQCLMTSLEELKVAEEEMLNQQLELLTTRAE